jgi:hypothetical protein
MNGTPLNVMLWERAFWYTTHSRRRVPGFSRIGATGRTASSAGGVVGSAPPDGRPLTRNRMIPEISGPPPEG